MYLCQNWRLQQRSVIVKIVIWRELLETLEREMSNPVVLFIHRINKVRTTRAAVSFPRLSSNSPSISRAHLPYGVSPRHFTSPVSECKWIKYRITRVYRRHAERIDRSGRADIRHAGGCTWWGLYTNWLDALRCHSGTGYPHPTTNPPVKLLWIGRSLQMLRYVVPTRVCARNRACRWADKNTRGCRRENNFKSIYFNDIAKSVSIKLSHDKRDFSFTKISGSFSYLPNLSCDKL